MSPESDDKMLDRILGQLAEMQRTINALAVDVATIKTGVEADGRSVDQLANDLRRGSDQTAADVRALGVRVQALELKSAEWTGAGGMAGKGVNWASSIVSALIVAAIVGGVTMLLRK